MQFITIFTAGLLTFLTPCVLPMIPVYLTALTGGNIESVTRGKRGQLIYRAFVFSLGFITVFTLMGLGISSIGAFLIGNKMIVELMGMLIITLFALKFLGIISIPFLDRVMVADSSKLKPQTGFFQSFLLGVLFAAGWTPCVGPVLGSVLTYTASNSADPIKGAMYLFTYGLGFAIPLLLTATFAEIGLKLIKGISPYLNKIEKIIGLLLLFLAGTMFVNINQEYKVSVNEHELLESVQTQVQDQLTMLYMYNPDCTVCQQMEPIVKELTQECTSHGVKINKIDVSSPTNRKLAQKYKIRGLPTFIFLDKDTETSRLVGKQTQKNLKMALSVLMGKPCPGVSFIDIDKKLEKTNNTTQCNYE